MANFDKKVLDTFIKDQLQLFPEEVASTPEEAAEFLEEMFAVVVKGKRGVRKYFEEAGVDMSEGDILEASEVFDVGDGRFLIVQERVPPTGL